MTVGTALESAALRLMGRKPAVFFSADGQFEMELCDLANEVAIDVAKYRDWQALQRVHTLVGDGVEDAFDLPEDYDRMLVKSDIQGAAANAFGYFHYSDINAFTFDQTRGFQSSPGGWIIYDGQMRFSPVPSLAATAIFPYITAEWARGSNNAAKSAFTDDADTFLLPERLLTLGLVWRWRENKKLDSTGDQEAFVKALDEYAAKDGGSRVIRSGSRSVMRGTHLAYPYALGGA